MDTETIPVRLPDGTEDVIRESNSTLQLARYMTVQDQESYETACDAIIDWKDTIKKRESFFSPIKRAMDAAKKIVLDKEKEAVGPLQKAIQIVEPRALVWRRLEEEKAAENQRRIEAEERKREEDRRMEQAIQLEKDGQSEQAQAVLEQPIEQMVIPMAPAVAKVAGLSTQKRYDFEVVDEAKISREFLTPDLSKIRKQVTALGPKAENVVGGIRIFVTESFRRRG